jgi:hypothetical protein
MPESLEVLDGSIVLHYLAKHPNETLGEVVILIVEHNPLGTKGSRARSPDNRFQIEIRGRLELHDDLLYIRTGATASNRQSDMVLVKELEANLRIHQKDVPGRIYEIDRSIELYKYGEDYIIRPTNKTTKYEVLTKGIDALFRVLQERRMKRERKIA